jgi:hypothetical protein
MDVEDEIGATLVDFVGQLNVKFDADHVRRSWSLCRMAAMQCNALPGGRRSPAEYARPTIEHRRTDPSHARVEPERWYIGR